MRKFSYYPLRFKIQHQEEKKNSEFKGHVFCLILSMSKYERAVKDKVHLFYISGFLCNYEKIWRNYEGKKKSTLKVQTPLGETQGFCLFNSFKG